MDFYEASLERFRADRVGMPFFPQLFVHKPERSRETSDPHHLRRWRDVASSCHHPYSTENLGSISCPSTTVCYAVGDGVIVSTNAGVTWQEQKTPVQEPWFTDITCPSTTTCYAVGFGKIIATDDSGRTWRQERLPSGSDPPQSVACTSTTSCVIVGNVLYCLLGKMTRVPLGNFSTFSTTDSGAQWIGHSLPKDVNPMGVTCTDVFTCYATTIIGSPDQFDNGDPGGIVATTDLGATWEAQSVPQKTGPITAITCLAVPSRSVTP